MRVVTYAEVLVVICMHICTSDYYFVLVLLLICGRDGCCLCKFDWFELGVLFELVDWLCLWVWFCLYWGWFRVLRFCHRFCLLRVAGLKWLAWCFPLVVDSYCLFCLLACLLIYLLLGLFICSLGFCYLLWLLCCFICVDSLRFGCVFGVSFLLCIAWCLNVLFYLWVLLYASLICFALI